ncbi:MAG: hypothetical protein K2K43_08170, partial [Alistipes sp.]|nr:hypothetical protein [Alistipes sp.]
LLLVNITNNSTAEYELFNGSGTPIGEFRPVLNGNAISSNDPAFGDIVAVYPAFAATVSNGRVSLSINKDWHKVDGGLDYVKAHSQLTAWTNDTSHGFAQNDIKVSYKITSVGSGETQKFNFKFRQLATWCKFEFDFTNTSEADYTAESLQQITITAQDGSKISGEAAIDFSDRNNPVLGEGTTNEVDWTFNTPSSMRLPFTRSMMMFPAVSGGSEMFKITAKTNLRTLTFYATPKIGLTAGTVVHFPMNIAAFTKTTGSIANMTYTDVKDATNKFIYYGTQNCILYTAAGTKTFSIAAHEADDYFHHQDGTTVSTNTKTAPTKAGVLWHEASMTKPEVTLNGTNLSVKVTNYGNAVVAIYNAANEILWSYHIWYPEENPEGTSGDPMPVYKNTKSGTYTVMKMALGAMQVASAEKNNTIGTNVKGCGLWYQWGRKDPLGRPYQLPAAGSATAVNTNGTIPVVVYNPNGTAIVTETANTNGRFFTNTDSGADNLINVVETMVAAGYAADGETILTEIDKAINGYTYPVSADRYMIDLSVKNPTKFANVLDGYYNNDWVALTNNNLWGNPIGYNFPYPDSRDVYKSIFDPCPQGYRVAPSDLWINFTTTGANSTNFLQFNVKGNGSATTVAASRAIYNANHGWPVYYEGEGTTEYDANGTATNYIEPTSGKTDFYPASGARQRASAALTGIGANSYAWSSAPYANNSPLSSGMYMLQNQMSIPQSFSGRAFGMPIRCVQEQS